MKFVEIKGFMRRDIKLDLRKDYMEEFELMVFEILECV